MDERAFEALAEAALEHAMERIESAGGGALDVDLDGGALTVELDSGGQYLLNRHAPTRELWLSSPASGAHHFARGPEGGWRDKRSGEDLAALLERELSQALGRPVSLAGMP